ncbi:MAG TPA: hypothetical protein VFQ43_19930 [Nitrososphaera sp.]|nr:hypothetical protein [Nitrososphaera sp.]
MNFQYWKHHDNDKWYWLGVTTDGKVLEKGGPHDTPIDVMMEIFASGFYEVGSTVTYRDKPGN